MTKGQKRPRLKSKEKSFVFGTMEKGHKEFGGVGKWGAKKNLCNNILGMIKRGKMGFIKAREDEGDVFEMLNIWKKDLYMQREEKAKDFMKKEAEKCRRILSVWITDKRKKDLAINNLQLALLPLGLRALSSKDDKKQTKCSLHKKKHNCASIAFTSALHLHTNSVTWMPYSSVRHTGNQSRRGNTCRFLLYLVWIPHLPLSLTLHIPWENSKISSMKGNLVHSRWCFPQARFAADEQYLKKKIGLMLYIFIAPLLV